MCHQQIRKSINWKNIKYKINVLIFRKSSFDYKKNRKETELLK